MSSNKRKQEFDMKIKELLNLDNDCFGYNIDGENYESYFNKNVWNEFYLEMQNKYPLFFKMYNNGSGGELEPKKQNGKLLPPKMASVASSSRFAYLSFRNDAYSIIKNLLGDIEEGGVFRFEDRLSVKGVSASANLDASYVTTHHAIYFEVKCHELFDSHYIDLSKSYFKNGVLYGDQINSLQLNCIQTINSSKEGYYRIAKSEFGIEDNGKLYLDVKQFICHLLGIANTKQDKKELIYLYFKPASLKSEFDFEFEMLEKQFKAFCSSKYISSFCERNKISLRLVYAVNDKMTDEFNSVTVLKYSY